MQFLRANTQVIVTIGPFVDKDDALTPETGIDLSTADEAELLKHGSATVVDIAAATWAAVTSCDGYYSLTLTTSHTDTEGMLVVVVQDDSVCLPVKAEFMVLAEAAWDSMFVAKDDGYMDVNFKTISDDAITAASIATGAFTADAFAADAIVAATLATGAITADAFAADALVAATFATGCFTADAFAANALVAATFATSSLDGKGDWSTSASVGTPAAIDGQAATVAGMLTAAYNRVERNAGMDRLAVYGNAKLFDFQSGEDSLSSWPSVVWDSGNSKWVIFYTTRIGGVGGHRCIRRMDSDDGKTSWANAQTCVDVGADGQWDDGMVFGPVVWIESGTWYMLYSGRNSPYTELAIGLATSADGVTWAKSESNPIVQGVSDWDYDSSSSAHTCEVIGAMKVSSTYYVYTSTSVSPGTDRKIGVATGTDLTALSLQSTPVFGDADDTADVDRYSGYYSASPLNYNGWYWLITSRYGTGGDFAKFELWYSANPLFPEDERYLAKTILATVEGTNFPNLDIDFPCVATDSITRSTFTYTSGEFRLYFGGCQDDTGVSGGVWYTGLATASNIRDVLRATHPIEEDIRRTIGNQFTAIKGSTWSSSTDTLEAIRDRGDAAWLTATGFSTLDAAGVRTAVGLASANLDTQIGTLATSAAVNAQVLDVLNVDTLIDGKTIVEALQIAGSILAGEVSGAGTGTETFKGLDGETDRVVVTVDEDGNRTGVTYS